VTDSKPRVAPQIVFDVSPGLGRLNEEILFGKVWPDATLSQRDRSLVTLSVLVALGCFPQVGFHAGLATTG
jgi:4-carboxymuconolactone decarboxylase